MEANYGPEDLQLPYLKEKFLRQYAWIFATTNPMI